MDSSVPATAVLVVTETRWFGEVLQGLLRRERLSSTVVYDASLVPQALDSIAPELVLLDAAGTVPAGSVRGLRETRNVPVIVLGRGPADGQADTLLRGASDYLEQPVRGSQLVARVHETLQWVRARSRSNEAA